MITDFVGNIYPPKSYREHWCLDMIIEAEPVGFDPETGEAIYFGEGTEISCPLHRPVEDYPF